MKFEIPLSAIESEAALIGAASLCCFIRDFPDSLERIEKEKGGQSSRSTVEEIKESFYTYLYKKLLSREFEEIDRPRAKKSTPFNQYMEMALDSASRIVLEIYRKSLRKFLRGRIVNDLSIIQNGAQKISPDEVIKYFYADYLASVYKYFLAVKMDRKIHAVEDLKKFEFRTDYFNAMDKYCRDSIRASLRMWKFDTPRLKSGNEQDILPEIKKLVRVLKREPYVKREKQRHRPLTRYVVCGSGIDEERIKALPNEGISGRAVRLDADMKDGNINLRESQLEEAFGKKLSPESKDLLEIAGYIYVGDNLIPRGPRWRRSIHFLIPVRKYRLWTKLKDHFNYTLSFLSGDSISVEFCKYQQEHKKSSQKILKKKKINADCVSLLSGGVDSFAGTLKLIKDNKRPLIISHFSQSPIAHVQKELGDFLGEYVDKKKEGSLVHLILKIGKQIRQEDGSNQDAQEKKEIQIDQVEESQNDNQKNDLNLPSHNRENSQRMRSFLYFSLASIAAAELELTEFCITENGISSFNLPITPAYFSTRCGRPTHPRNLYNFSQIVNQLYKKDIFIHNPYTLKTKSELIKAAVSTPEEEDRLRSTVTCPKFSIGVVFDRRRRKRVCHNCGACYECILRVGSIRGADIEPGLNQYVVNPYEDLDKLTDIEQTTLIRFIHYWWEIERKSSSELVLRYPDLCLPQKYFPDERNSDVCMGGVSLHKRFAAAYLNWLVESGGDKVKNMTGLYSEKPFPAVDIHCHVGQYPDPFYVLAKAKYENIKIVSVGMNFRSSLLNFQLRRYFDSIIPAAGLHPLDVPHFNGGHFLRFAKLFDKTDFIGEIGLDYYFEKNKESYPRQREVFWDILTYCKGKNKIFNVHSKGAEKDVLDMLGKQDAKQVIMHWFSGPEGLIPVIKERGYYISVNRAIFSSKKVRKYIEMLPREQILTESDGPGDRIIHKNSPFYVRRVTLEIAKIWKVSEEEAQCQIYKNFAELVGE